MGTLISELACELTILLPVCAVQMVLTVLELYYTAAAVTVCVCVCVRLSLLASDSLETIEVIIKLGTVTASRHENASRDNYIDLE